MTERCVAPSCEIVHECDMALNVEKGIAVSTKNRFKEKGMTLDGKFDVIDHPHSVSIDHL